MENKRVLVGKVVSDKTDKTITVLVETYKKDSLYGKRVKYSKKYAAHDEANEAKVGDTVKIVETRLEELENTLELYKKKEQIIDLIFNEVSEQTLEKVENLL